MQTFRAEPEGRIGSLSRRSVVRIGGGLAAGLAASGLHPAAAQTPSATTRDDRATFVLVAGALAGGWAWRKVIPLLREAGHEVYAVTPTGLGDRTHLADPAINLDVYITDVVNVLAYEDLHDVILVGHSSAGFIITGVAEQVPERLSRLVYLDALVPEDGQSLYDFWDFGDEGVGFEYRAGVDAGWPGFEVLYPGFEEFLRMLIRDPADADWFVSKLTPQPMATSSQPLELGNPAASEVTRAFIFCTEDKGTADEDGLVRLAERVRSDPAWDFLEIADNHMALVNDPQATAEALLSLV